MGTYVYRARAPKKGFATVTLKDPVVESLRGKPFTIKAAVAEYAYRASYVNHEEMIAAHSRFIAPTERAWERWIEAVNERPEYIVDGEKVYRWNGLIGFYEYALDSWDIVDAEILQ